MIDDGHNADRCLGSSTLLEDELRHQFSFAQEVWRDEHRILTACMYIDGSVSLFLAHLNDHKNVVRAEFVQDTADLSNSLPESATTALEDWLGKTVAELPDHIATFIRQALLEEESHA